MYQVSLASVLSRCVRDESSSMSWYVRRRVEGHLQVCDSRKDTVGLACMMGLRDNIGQTAF